MLFAAAKAEEVAEVDAGGDFAEVAAADEGGAEAGELALAGAWEAAEERFGNDEAEDSVAYEFKLLVVGGGMAGGRDFPGRIGLVGERTMGERPGEEIGPFESDGRRRRRSLLLLRLSGLFVALGHSSPLRFTLPDDMTHHSAPRMAVINVRRLWRKSDMRAAFSALPG